MPTIISKRCPKCSTLLERTQIGCDIGDPVLECWNCKTYCIDRHKSEWDIMGNYRKIELLTYRGMIASIYGAVIGTVPVLAICCFFGENKIFGPDKAALLIPAFFLAIGLGISFKINIRTLQADIIKSRNRLKIKSYQDKLKRAGLLS